MPCIPIGVEHKYLLDADFNKMPPVPEELGGWYGIVCRLDSFEHAHAKSIKKDSSLVQ